jgi:NAD(P)-dependent dehydrogenase (short-subunit alcohol dehydrogenase family)
MNRRSFENAVVLVTGAGGGLGRALALRFAAEGARIAALDQYLGGVEELAQELAARGRECLPMACDVTDADACDAAVAATLSRFGAVDVLVNNAGISHRSAFASTQPAVIRRVMDVNFFGSVHCTRAALDPLLASRGLIIAISSVAGFSPLIARTGYSASKHAMHGFFESLRTELVDQGVGVMLVCPSFIETGIDRNALGGDGAPVRHGQVVIGRRLSPTEVADRIVTAARRDRRLLLVGGTAHLAWWVSRLAPGVFARGMARRLRREMQ